MSVKSGHGVGKSCSAALAALWFKYSYQPSIVLTTAPTERQVKEILWREIRYRKAGAIQELPGKPLTMKLDLGPIDFMLGFSTNNVQQIQGFHSPNIMIIIDEANGYPSELYEPIEGLLSGGERKILFQIGNPINPIGPFFKSFSDGLTCCHTISCLNHPNVKSGKNIIPGAVTLEWVNRMRSLWGEDSSFWQSRVLGEFPKTATDIVINLVWVEHAEQLKIREKYTGKDIYMGVDPGEYGNDEFVWFIGTKHQKIEVLVKRHIEPAETVGITKRLMTKYSIPAEHITCDGIGAGATICSQLKLDGVKVNRFVASNTAIDDKTFADRSVESWWNIRTLLNPESDEYEGYAFNGRADKLKADLCTRKYTTDGKGKFKLEPKEVYRKRMKRSPNYADAMMHCYSFMSRRKVYSYVILPNVIGD